MDTRPGPTYDPPLRVLDPAADTTAVIRLATIACTRTAAHALLWTVLLVFALGARASLHLCTGDCCGAATAGPATACCAGSADAGSADGAIVADGACCCRGAGCAGTAADTRDDDGDGDGAGDGERVRRQPCRNGCCQDLLLQLDEGPLPRRVALDDPPAPAAAAALPPRAPFALDVVEPEPRAPATGPPRRDRRTLLLSTTVLRL